MPEMTPERSIDQIKVDENIFSAQTSSSEITQFYKGSLDLERKQLINRELEWDIGARKEYASKLYWFLSLWSICLLAILVFCGLGCIYLSDKVLVTLLAGTTIEIVGLFVIVTRYIFPKKNS